MTDSGIALQDDPRQDDPHQDDPRQDDPRQDDPHHLGRRRPDAPAERPGGLPDRRRHRRRGLRSGPPRALRLRLRRWQRRAALALGVSWSRRTATVVAMLESNARRVPGYWIQLALATGIATLGLVLGSAAVVIGGMLVSPLMNPIVELGMGIAAGSSLLTIHASFRVLRSVLGVILAAMVVTYLLPFHEITPEIASRTAPTALDLAVAVCCAFAAVYTTVRATADTTAAAAGTAIGIALVPPICVVGYGLGTGSRSVATGAGLLFTANFSAIVVIAVLSFWLLGFHRVNARRLENEVLDRCQTVQDRTAVWVHDLLGRAFGSRYGLAMRLCIPATVARASSTSRWPTRSGEVAWEVGARAAVQRALATEAPHAVQTEMSVVQHHVSLSVLMLGSDEQAAELRRHLEHAIAMQAGVRDPEVTVTAVAGARALADAVARAERRDSRGPPVAVTVAAPAHPAADFRARVGAVLRAQWPTAAIGPLVAWEVRVPGALTASPDTSAGVAGAPVTTVAASPITAPMLSTVLPLLASSGAAGPTADQRTDAPTVVTLRHLGAPLGAAAEAMLAAELRTALGGPVRVVPVALPAEPVVAAPGAPTRWLRTVGPILGEVAATPGAWACVEMPGAGRPSRVRRALQEEAVAKDGRLQLTRGRRWALRVAMGSCDA